MSKLLGPDGKPLKMRTVSTTYAVKQDDRDPVEVVREMSKLAEKIRSSNRDVLRAAASAADELQQRDTTGGFGEVCTAVAYSAAVILFRDAVEREMRQKLKRSLPFPHDSPAFEIQ